MATVSYSDELTKVGAIFGFYFVIQAYGYTIGFEDVSLAETKGISINKAVVFGFHHISCFFRPWGEQAWPLTPALGLPALLFTLYLPKLLHNSDVPGTRTLLNYYFALVLNVLFFPFAAGLLGRNLAVDLVKLIDFSGHPWALSAIYFIAWLAWYAVFFNLVKGQYKLIDYFHDPKLPRAEFLTAMLIGMLLLSVYLGSEFDGALDRYRVYSDILGPYDASNPPDELKELTTPAAPRE
ncbi:MAG: hypothetical protein AAGF10_02570 [Verrucomicrobiota bacterium]